MRIWVGSKIFLMRQFGLMLCSALVVDLEEIKLAEQRVVKDFAKHQSKV